MNRCPLETTPSERRDVDRASISHVEVSVGSNSKAALGAAIGLFTGIVGTILILEATLEFGHAAPGLSAKFAF